MPIAEPLKDTTTTPATSRASRDEPAIRPTGATTAPPRLWLAVAFGAAVGLVPPSFVFVQSIRGGEALAAFLSLPLSLAGGAAFGTMLAANTFFDSD